MRGNLVPAARAAPVPVIRRSTWARRAWGWPALLVLTVVMGYVGVPDADTPWALPVVWPAAGLTVGLMLTAPARWRPWIWALLAVLGTLSWAGQGTGWGAAVGYTLTYLAAAEIVRRRITRGGRQVRLSDEGDVSILIGAAALGSAVATIGILTTRALLGAEISLGIVLSAFGGIASTIIVLVPLFMVSMNVEPLAGRSERVLSSAITVVTTAVVFSDLVPAPIAFAVMPMFAWHAFRGTLREATWVLVVSTSLATTFTSWGLGPLAGLGSNRGFSPDTINAVLQLFVLDCGLILLPIAVIVTQQRRAVAQATTERRTLQRLIQSASGTAILATGRDGRVTLFNPAAEELWDYDAEQVLGELPDMLWGEDELHRMAARLGTQPVVADLWRASADQEPGGELWRSTRRDDSHRVAQVTVSPVLDEDGKEAGHMLTATDVTERERSRQALEETLEHQSAAVDRLQELERVKGDFVATVSHELRTPITSIIGYLELLEDGDVGDLDEAQLDVIGRVHRNGTRLLTLIEDLLTLSQIETSRLDLEPTLVDLRDLAREAHGNLATVLRGREIEVELRLPPQPVPHDVDPAQVVRMFDKLLSNAVKFTPDGGRVGVHVRRVEHGTEIVVSDTGQGIAAHEQEQLFQRFYRSESATSQAIQGTGLGLTIVQAIVTLHGGRIGVDSTPGQGTEVTVWLPTAVATPARVQPLQPIGYV